MGFASCCSRSAVEERKGRLWPLLRLNSLSDADSELNKQKLRAQTDRAMALEMFGAPTFSVGNEIFFGQDRMDDAFEWARQPWMDAGR